MGEDLDRPDLPELGWSPQQRDASLTTVFEHGLQLAGMAERWYATKRPAKKLWGRTLRVAALIIGSVAVVLPVLSEIYATDDRPAVAPGWSAIALAAAATLVALDHFFGFTSAWTRFMAAEMRLTRLRHDFSYSWNARRAACNGAPTDTDVSELLALARSHVLAVDDLVAEETGSWVTEFRGTLDKTQQNLGKPGE